MWLDGSRLGTHGCSWATWIPSFVGRMGRGKGESAETTEKDSTGHTCCQLHAPTSTSMQREPWQPLLSPVYTLPVGLLLTACISESQPRKITLWSSLAQEHRLDIWSSLEKLPVSKVFQPWSQQNYWELQNVRIATGPCQTSSKQITFLWMWSARLHLWMCSWSSYCRNQINNHDAMDSKSNLGGRGKTTFSGAHYRLLNDSNFRLEVIVLDRETRTEHCSPAGQEGKGL